MSSESGLKPIPGYEGLYSAHPRGGIYSHRRNKYLSLSINTNGYLKVGLYKDNKNKVFSVHRLIALSFHKNEKKLPCVNHKDGNKLNNSSENLEWCSWSENNKHAFKTGLNSRKGIRNQNSKLTEENVLEIKKLLKTNIFQKEIAKMFNVTVETISAINVGKTWKEVGEKNE